jgi:hypothetical protein
MIFIYKKGMNIIYWIVTSFFFVIYWVLLPSWIQSGDVELYGLIGSGIAANGGFIGNIVWTIMTKNDKYKYYHNGKDMPFVVKLKKIFKVK